MIFEWDDAKSRRNLLERGFGFDHAAAIFIGPTLEAQDNRRDYGEVRVHAIGCAGDDILSVVYPDRGEVRRIISAGSPTERSANYGNRSSNTGENPPNETED